ncbi:aromatic compound dioxygenase [Aureobasidium sp. EXF-12298]|nr:aromatic compound dioxygenase [Aureobasidium sp. EXF-12298]KAI4758743.1 aromatic compound dioxygenase [Aureobasidium sp. EXF-12344]KAI4775934.1 aromatic compound dioxygenase [Aureobasidium sp. EXF-3400]
MVKIHAISAALLTASLSSSSHAHPEEHEMADALAKRAEHAAIVQRGLEACYDHPKFLEMQKRGQERRWEKAQQLRKARGIHETTPFKTRRDLAALESFEEVNHNLTSLGYTDSTAPSVLFANYKNASCILTPEAVVGPYFVIGEYYRTNVVESQGGVPVHLEYQYIDTSTCEPATGLYLEAWQANSTGVYSGVVASGNGNDADTSNLDTTYLRGVTKVDSEGVGYFDTIFPGHYAGRSTHIHLIAQQNGTVYDNGTYSGGTISHVGQLFFDESLKSAVYDTYPYTTNTQSYTTNDDDMWAPDQADNNYDPIPDYAYLGEDISDGLLMWISVGINMSAEYTVTAAATLTADGGVASNDAADGASGSGAGSASNSTGSMPSGSGAAGSAPTGDQSMSMGSAPNGSQSMGSAPSGAMGGGSGGSFGPGSSSTVTSGTSSAFSASSVSQSASSSTATVSSSASVKASSSTSGVVILASSASTKVSSSSAKIASSVASIKLSTSSVDKAKTSASHSSTSSSSASKSSSSTKSASTSKTTTPSSGVKPSASTKNSSIKPSSSTKTSSVKTSTSTKPKSSTSSSKSSSSTKYSASTRKSSTVKKSSSSTSSHAASGKSSSAKKITTSTKKTSSSKKGSSTLSTKTSSKKH